MPLIFLDWLPDVELYISVPFSTDVKSGSIPMMNCFFFTKAKKICILLINETITTEYERQQTT